ncbi:unnamed protein product [Penicillium olsonii]|uniref:Zn(2)-C6 fungal-type domain-containing protein n=1 Tax=Penicillium olsonii TaxID=99116 RepID=A0A9W4MTQ2_PENOL|nr:unnamed protein product [Penicillium olsonii]CAG8076578.1 unnamed protein product [Penicillium olsonii]
MENACKDKRTNSLAFARSDCHTCAAANEQCDRRRPRCSTCLDHGRKCGGFATPLSWDTRRMWSDNPSVNRENGTGNFNGDVVNGPEPSSKRPTPRRFRFIGGASRPKKRKICRGHNSVRARSAQDENTETMPRITSLDPTDYDHVDHELGIAGIQDPDPLHDLWAFDSFMPNIFGSTNLFDLGQDLTDMSALISLSKTPPSGTEKLTDARNDDEVQINSLPTDIDPQVLVSTPKDGPPQGVDQSTSQVWTSPRLPADPEPAGLSPHDHEWLLQMYDYEFCVLPLTSDISINPFRCQRQTSQGSLLLFHSILALCCQHLRRLTGSWATEADEHRRKALQLLDEAVQHQQAHSKLSLLEPILILFTLDCTLSAAGKWTTHLHRAHTMLQVCGGPMSLTTPRVRSQVGMLLWWDATLALISRHGPIMDPSYLEFLIKWERKDNWSFFDLTGCPGDLIVHLFHLAELARQSEIARSMKWLSFNIAPVIAIEEKVTAWTNNISPVESDPEMSDTEAEKQFHEQQDRFYCAEAWRFTLLLYIESVFKSDRQKRHFAINKLVRQTIDSIRCCRQTSQTQKQLLLPVFLAGSETSDEAMRDFVKNYCSYWGEKSRYGMFNSTPVLLDEIWTTGKWWGEVIDSKTKSPGNGQGQTQLLFG